jgi:hypothetical protein
MPIPLRQPAPPLVARKQQRLYVSPEGCGKFVSLFISLATDGVHQIADTMCLGIDDVPCVLPLEQTIPLSADGIAVQVAKCLTRITIDIVHVLDLEDCSPETVRVQRGEAPRELNHPVARQAGHWGELAGVRALHVP